MIKFNAKELKRFELSDFSGGINTDTKCNLKELLQCKNLIIDSKGTPCTRGGSRILNLKTPIGKKDIYVRGYIFGYAGAPPTYGSNFSPTYTLAASSVLVGSAAANANDGDGDTYWTAEPDKALAGTMSASSGANPENMNDDDDGTAWEAVI